MIVMGLRGRGGRPEVQMSSIGFWVRGRRVEEDAAREALRWWAMLWEMQWGSMPTLEGEGWRGLWLMWWWQQQQQQQQQQQHHLLPCGSSEPSDVYIGSAGGVMLMFHKPKQTTSHVTRHTTRMMVRPPASTSCAAGVV